MRRKKREKEQAGEVIKLPISKNLPHKLWSGGIGKEEKVTNDR